MKCNPVTFQGTIETSSSSCPPVLESFSRWLLSGNNKRKRSDVIETHMDILAKTTSYNIMHNMKTERQVTYGPENPETYRPRHSYVPVHTIAMGLALRSYDRNNPVINLLSAPNYGLSITPRACLQWETAIANTVLKNISENGSYVPPGVTTGIPVFFSFGQR